MKNLLAIGLACVLPTGLAAEDPGSSEASLGTMTVIVMDESPAAKDSGCANASGCMAFNRAVLTRPHAESFSAARARALDLRPKETQ